MTPKDYAKLTQEINDGYLTETFEPIKCTKCKSTETTDNTLDTAGGHVSEFDRLCANCGTFLGYWSYGNWQV